MYQEKNNKVVVSDLVLNFSYLTIEYLNLYFHKVQSDCVFIVSYVLFSFLF